MKFITTAAGNSFVNEFCLRSQSLKSNASAAHWLSSTCMVSILGFCHFRFRRGTKSVKNLIMNMIRFSSEEREFSLSRGPPWPNGEGVPLLRGRFRVRVPAVAYHFYL